MPQRDPIPVRINPQPVPTTCALAVWADQARPKDFTIYQIEFVNQSGEDATVWACDGNNTPWVPPTVMANNSVLTDNAEHGRLMVGGLKWQSSVDGVTGYAYGTKIGE